MFTLTLDGIAFDPADSRAVRSSPTPQPPWSNPAVGVDGPPFGYYRDCMSVVHLRGFLTDPSVVTPPTVTCATMADDFPTAYRVFPTMTGPVDVGGRVDVLSSGLVEWTGGYAASPQTLSLANISYLP